MSIQFIISKRLYMIKPLTSLRFIFAFMVFTSHLSFFEESRSGILTRIYNSVLHEGYIGVSFLFYFKWFYTGL